MLYYQTIARIHPHNLVVMFVQVYNELSAKCVIFVPPVKKKVAKSGLFLYGEEDALELATPVASNTRTKLTDVSLAEVLERLS